MKYIFFSIIAISILAVLYLGYSYFNVNLITLANPIRSKPIPANIASNSNQFYYGMSVEMSQILPGSERYIVNSHGKDLIDIASDLGINMLRITNSTRSFNDEKDAIYTKAQWNTVLDKMQNKGIKAIILIETASNNGDYYSRDTRPIYLDLVKSYIIDPDVPSHPAVYAIDIQNEPIITQNNLNYLKQASEMIKTKYPRALITIGWWGSKNGDINVDVGISDNKIQWDNYLAGKYLNPYIDFYSIHMYGFDKKKFGIYIDPELKTKIFISQVKKALETTKPILIEEFGAANGDAVSDQDTIGSQELQASVYRGVYQALADMSDSQIIGTIGFQFYSRDAFPDAWAITKNRGDYLYPVTNVIKSYATNNLSLISDTKFNSPFSNYLLTDRDNKVSKDINVGDKVGLKYSVDTKYKYQVALSNPGILKQIESMHYDKEHHSYYALFEAVQKGSTDLKILDVENCENGIACNDKHVQVFTYTLNVVER